MNYVFIVTVSAKIDTRSVTEENICQEEYQGYKGMFVQFSTLTLPLPSSFPLQFSLLFWGRRACMVKNLMLLHLLSAVGSLY